MANPKMPTESVAVVEKLLSEGKTSSEIQKATGVSIGAISNIRTGKLDAQLVIQRAQQRELASNRRYKDALDEIDRLNRELAATAMIGKHARGRKPIEITPKHGGKGEATPVICANDWHLEERVERAAVNGVNEFNLEVAKKRITRFWQTAASLVDMCKSRSRIDTIIVNLMGDFISGYLHDELAASNELTPAEAVLLAYDYLVDGIEFLRKETKAKRIIVPCVCGNHGRFTKKMWAKLGPGVNFEYLLYAMIDKWFRAHTKSVEVMLPTGDMTYIKVYGRTIRVMHGDAIRYAGGIGGVHIPLRKALDVWNSQVRADYNYLGHWHSDMTGEDYRMSGSLIGYSEWSLRIKARYRKPSQAFEIQHPRYDSTANFPIILE
jgi:hypothetical protein